jgi:signal transduction histidine kinase
MRTHHSLKLRISLLITLLTGSLMASVIVGTFLVLTDDDQLHLEAKEAVFARFTEHLSREALLSRDYANLQLFLRDQLSDNEINHLCVANDQKIVVASSNPVEIGRNMADIHNGQTHARRVVISNAAGRLGEVHLEFNHAQVERLKKKVLNFSLLAAVLATGFSCICGYLAGGLLTRRLERLKEAVQQFNFDGLTIQAEQQGADEIALLSGTFNEMGGRIKVMLDELRNQSHKLETLNLELDRRVVERTAQLEEANLLLSREAAQHKQARDEISALNADLHQQKSALEIANKDLESFGYSISHDLRAPLRHISGFSQMLLEEYNDRLDDSGRDLINRIGKASGRMGEMINAVLRLSQLSQASIQKEQIELSTLASSIICMFRESEPERRVTVTIADGVVGWGDRVLLDVVMQNLLANAWKFTALNPEAVIEFGTSMDSGVREYYVRDNGVGFDNDLGNRLFGVFQRLHTEKDFPGMGIGLATVKRIIERHGGTIRAEGITGAGATFFFTLPGQPSA